MTWLSLEFEVWHREGGGEPVHGAGVRSGTGIQLPNHKEVDY